MLKAERLEDAKRSRIELRGLQDETRNIPSSVAYLMV